MKKKWFQNILSGVFITVLIFAFFEIGVRVLVKIHPYYDVEMWRYATLLKEKAPEVAMSHRHITNQKARLYGVDISTNSKGLRDREFDYEKKTGTYRILFLGDSLTLGWGVAFEDLFAKKLEPKLSNFLGRSVEIINTGIGNYNTEQEWTYYKTEGYKYDLDEVMLLYFINDAEPTPKYSVTSFKENSMLVVFLWSRIKKIMVKLGGSKNFIDYYKDLYNYQAPGWKVSRNSLLALRESIQSKGGRFLVAVCPELRSFRSSYPFKESHDKILNFLKDNAINHVDLLPVFQEKIVNEEDVWVTWEDSHPNALGHQIITEGIFDYYKKHSPKPRKP